MIQPANPAAEPVVPAAPVLSDNPEADAAALAAYEAAQAKHKTPEELDSEAAAAEAGEETAKEAVESAGLDFESLTAEVLETGDLTPESYEALAKIGISEDMVKVYLKGIEASAEVQIETVLAPAGGAEGFAKISAWAAQELSDEDLAEYNTAVNNPTTAAFAVKALAARYAAAEGAPASLIAPSNSPREARGVTAFESSAEVVEAMRDPRYRTDPAYQRQVQQRLSASPGVF